MKDMIPNDVIVEGMYSIHKNKFPSRHGKVLASIHEAKPGMEWPAVEQMVASIPELLQGRIVVLSGTVGNGKTLASYVGALIYEWRLKVEREYLLLLKTLRDGDDQEFIEYEIFDGPDEQQAYRLAMKKYARNYGQFGRFLLIEAPDYLKDAARTDSRTAARFGGLFVLDDLGIEYYTDSGFGAAEWDSLIKARYRLELPTIITTNLTLAQFKERYDVRIYDRLKECATWITINEKSLRSKNPD